MRIVQLIRGNTAFNNSLILAEGAVSYDTQAKELRLHDGTTPGGARIPNVGTIPSLSRSVFTGIATKGVATNIPGADVDKFLTLSAAGNHILPDRSTLLLGAHFWFNATVAGVVIQAYDAGQQIADRGSLGNARSLNQHETIHLGLVALAGTTAWRVLSSY